MAQLITILNGPNLNLLGQRQPEIYGHDTLDDVAKSCTAVAAQFGLRCELMQSNHEGALIDMIHTARQTSAGIIINPAAFTHTSIALLDACIPLRARFSRCIFQMCINARASAIRLMSR